MALGLLLVADVGTHARAEDTRERARALFLQANQSFEKQDYHRALELYREAHALFPSHKIEYNIGATLMQMGYQTKAAEHFEAFLQKPIPKADQAFRVLAEDRLNRLRAALGRILLWCGQDGVEVEADAWKLGVTPIDRALYLTPGTYTLRLRKAGFKEWVRQVVLTPGAMEDLNIPLLDPVEGPDPKAAKARPPSEATNRPRDERTPEAGAAVRISGTASGPPPNRTLPLVPGAKESTEKPDRSEDPIYQKWWFWLGSAGAVAAVATAIIVPVVMLSRDPVEAFDPELRGDLP